MAAASTSAAPITIRVNGTPLRMAAGTSVAAALLLAKTPSRISISGEPRAPICGMGVCMECRATVDGIQHARTCQIVAQDGMQVETA